MKWVNGTTTQPQGEGLHCRPSSERHATGRWALKWGICMSTPINLHTSCQFSGVTHLLGQRLLSYTMGEAQLSSWFGNDWNTMPQHLQTEPHKLKSRQESYTKNNKHMAPNPHFNSWNFICRHVWRARSQAQRNGSEEWFIRPVCQADCCDPNAQDFISSTDKPVHEKCLDLMLTGRKKLCHDLSQWARVDLIFFLGSVLRCSPDCTFKW